ncbi:MAG: hypothetical protein R2855_09745 [Thermomicrobiales bacterium]
MPVMATFVAPALLLTDGLDKLGRFLPACMGIDTQALWDASAALLTDIERRLATKSPSPLVLVFLDSIDGQQPTAAQHIPRRHIEPAR